MSNDPKAPDDASIVGYMKRTRMGWQSCDPTDSFAYPIVTPGLVDKITKLEARALALESALRDIVTAASDIESTKSSSFKARNGRVVSLQADDGEMAYAVHSDHTHALSLSAHAARAVLEPVA